MRLTRYARGGGCACKLPAEQLEAMLSGFVGGQPADDRLVVGLDDGDDAAVIRLDPASGRGLVMTTDFFTPVVDDPYDWGRIAAANALSDVYAMGGQPLLAVNLLCWPAESLPLETAAEVLRGGREISEEAGCPLVGGHTINGAEPTYGLAVAGLVDLDRLMRIDAARPGLPLTLTKPIGTGVLNARLKATGQASAAAVHSMVTLNRDAAVAAVRHGVRAATDVTGFGLLGHTYKLCRASGVSAVIEVSAVPVLDGARDAAERGHIPGGSRRNLGWVRPHLDPGRYDELDQLLLADAQTSGGLLVVGEVPGYPVIGELTEQTGTPTIALR